MGLELESVWGAMKDVHYRRTLEKLERGISGTKNLEGALTAALDEVVGAVHAVAGTCWFYDRFGDGRIRPKAVYGGADLSGISLLPGEGIAGEVVESGSSTIVSDCQKDPRWSGKTDQKTGFRTESMICVPLKLEDNVFGCIQIINRTDRMLFDKKDLAFAERLAGFSAQLFRKQGLLEGYVTDAMRAREERAISFGQVFGAADDKEMEKQLRKTDEFAALRSSDQDTVLRLARDMRRYFAKRGDAARRSSVWR